MPSWSSWVTGRARRCRATTRPRSSAATRSGSGRASKAERARTLTRLSHRSHRRGPMIVVMAHALAPDPKQLSTLVVIPTYNESENIKTVLRRVHAVMPDVHVLVVDDGSPDGTAERGDELARELGGISVLRRPARSGLGSAYRD